MNLIVDKIECINRAIKIRFNYENATDIRIEDINDIKLGIRNGKRKYVYVFEDISVSALDLELSFSLNDSIKELFLSTDIDNFQFFIQFEHPQISDFDSEIHRYYLKNVNRCCDYVISYENALRIYFSKSGFLSADRKYQVRSIDEEIIYLSDNDYSIDGNRLIIDYPYDIDKVEDVYALISEYCEQYSISSDVYDNCICRYSLDLSKDIISVDLNDIYVDDSLNNKWLSVQILFLFKDNTKSRIFIGVPRLTNGFSDYDMRKKGFDIGEISNSPLYKILYTSSNIGFIFTKYADSYVKYPLCTARLKELKIEGNKTLLSIDCKENSGDYHGIVIEDSFGNYKFIKSDSFADNNMFAIIESALFECGFAPGISNIFVLSYMNNVNWLMPIVVKESDEASFTDTYIEDARGCKCKYKLGICNQLQIHKKVSNHLQIDNRIDKRHNGIMPLEWTDLPAFHANLSAHVLVREDCVVVQPINYIFLDYASEINVIICPTKPHDNKDFFVIKNVEKTSTEIRLHINDEESLYISKHGICRFGIYIKTRFCEYFLQLSGVSKKHKNEKCRLFDRRDYFLESINCHIDDETEYELQPYYSFDGKLSVHCIRKDNRFKSQMSAVVDDVGLCDGILTVSCFVNDAKSGCYSGFCLEFRNKIEEDAVTIKFSDVQQQLSEKGELVVGKIDLKQLSLDGSTWDIKLLYNQGGYDYPINMYLIDNVLRDKFRDPYNSDEYIYDDGTVVFPYCTYGNTVALLHREYYEKFDSVDFRSQEAEAIKEYRKNKEYYDKQNIVLIFEKFGTCSDNAYHLFKYCMDNDCEKRIKGHIYYIISNDSVDYENVKDYKDHLVEFGSLKHQIYLLAARLFISSDTNVHAYIYRVKDSYIVQEIRRKKYIFIDHGIAALKNGSYIYGKGKQGEPTWYTVASDFQKEIIQKYYGLAADQLRVTGLARWDVLEDRSAGKKKILIAPTWRRSLDDVTDEKFLNSVFCVKYIELLTDDRFSHLLEKYDAECDFYMHLKFANYLKAFKEDTVSESKTISSRINIYSFGDKAINDLYMECSMMITDYSSVAFDTLWQNKPVVFYQFDMDDFDEMWGAMIDLDKELPGDHVSNIDDLLTVVEEYMDNDFSIKKCYLPRAKKFFKYIDHNNCKRVWKVVEEIWNTVSYKEKPHKEKPHKEKPHNECITKPIKFVHPYLTATSEGRVGLKTILQMLPRWFSYKMKHLFT